MITNLRSRTMRQVERLSISVVTAVPRHVHPVQPVIAVLVALVGCGTGVGWLRSDVA